MSQPNMFQLTILLCVIISWGQAKEPCPRVLTVDITDGQKLDDNAIFKDGVHFAKHNYFVNNETIYGCICNIKKLCIRKCCGPNEIMMNKTCFPSSLVLNLTLHHGAQPQEYEEHHFLHNMECESDKILLMPHLASEDIFYVQKNGSLYLPNFESGQMRNPEDYCVDIFNNENMDYMVSALICLKEDDYEEETNDDMYNYGKF